MNRAFFKVLILCIIFIAPAPACALSPDRAPESRDFLLVNMNQKSWPVRTEAADFGADIGKVVPGMCVNTTGLEMENHGTAWTEIRSLRGWYDWNSNLAYHRAWIPSSILKQEPACGQAWDLVNEIFKAVLPGVRSESGKVCGSESKSESFFKYTMNQPAMIRWLDRRMPGGVNYEQIQDSGKPATRRLAPSDMIVEFAGLPFTQYTTCGPDADASFFNAFEFKVHLGKTPGADRMLIIMDTGNAETLTLTLNRNIFKLVAQVDRGWKITKITRRPFKGE